MGRLQHRTAPGCTYFVTTKTWENREIFRVPENAAILVQSLLHYRDQGAFLLHEFVVMPNHLHVLLTPGGDTSLEKAMQFVKGGSSYQIHRQRGHKMEIWQPGFHEATVRDEKDFRGRQAYIQMNPVEARLAQNPASWPHGSASGWFAIDPIPEALSSGAEAQGQEPAIMSDLKVRPPKEPVSRSTQNSVSEVAVVQRRAAGKKGA